LELRDLPIADPVSAEGEAFAEAIKEVHDQVKTQLQQTTLKYKEYADKKKKDVQFAVGDLVWVHLKKDRLPKGKYTKLMQKKVGPCQILLKHGQNAYELQLPPDLGLSPIFNVCDLTPYKANSDADQDILQDTVAEDIPQHDPPQLQQVLDTRVVKQTRNKKYLEYLVSWKGQPNSEVVWMTAEQI